MAWIVEETSSQPWSYYSDEAINNAIEFANQMLEYGVTKEAIAGMLGNIDYESYVNPGQGEIDGFGYGLIQWTPSTDLTDYIEDPLSGEEQTEFIYNEGYDFTDRWLPRSPYNYTWDEFLQLTDVELVTKAYFKNRERGTWNELRVRLAWFLYDKIGGEKKKKLPIWMYTRRV